MKLWNRGDKLRDLLDPPPVDAMSLQYTNGAGGRGGADSGISDAMVSLPSIHKEVEGMSIINVSQR